MRTQKQAVKNPKPPIDVAPEPPMNEADRREALKQYLTHLLSCAEKRVADLSDALRKNPPAHVLEWSIGAFEAAGIVEVFSYALAALENEVVTRESMPSYALDRVLHLGSGGSSSTSPIGSHMDKCRLTAWVKLYEMVKS